MFSSSPPLGTNDGVLVTVPLGVCDLLLDAVLVRVALGVGVPVVDGVIGALGDAVDVCVAVELGDGVCVAE